MKSREASIIYLNVMAVIYKRAATILLKTVFTINLNMAIDVAPEWINYEISAQNEMNKTNLPIVQY